MTYYQTYISEELTKEKADVKALKKEISQMKKDVAATKKEVKKCENGKEKDQLELDVLTLQTLLATKNSNLYRLQQKVVTLETMKKLRYTKLQNGAIVETSKLDQFKKRFAKYRMEYEYTETGEGLLVTYHQGGVKGRLTLYACIYDFPEYVTFPQID